MPTATLLTSGNSTTDTTSYATASVTPSANSLLLAFNLHVAAASSAFEHGSSVTSNGVTWRTCAAVPVNESLGTSRTAVLTCWKGIQTSAPTAGVVTFNFTGTQARSLWAVVQVTSVDTSTPSDPVTGQAVGDANAGAIRSVSLFPGRSAATSGSLLCLRPRATNNIHVLAFAHLVNENSTPSGFTELADVTSAEGANLQVGHANPAILLYSSSWATSTAHWAAMAIEVAESGNTMYVSDPVANLYP